ncbi:MAG: Asp-tRNA(Asn)/Glu-tRNA(Gln) amidotransferase subunit GatA [Firmicutes bacterium]|nr:Asp-tRNA(Asn)/Glu-tRNA(Gln) amidotransferase subunit GatA [Bacillota bacterium]
MDITRLTISELAAGLADGSLTSTAITTAYLDRIAAVDEQVNAYICVCREQALLDAAAADARRAAGAPLSALDGVPVAVKDIFCTKGVKTTCASHILENFIPPYDSTCWKKMADAGMILLGKVNMDEFAMGSTTESSYFGITRNPFDLTKVPGGSSGGSAAAVAADMAPAALGTDTGGSIRQPAHFCGVVGIKPTYGRISRYGIIPYASSLDQAGIFAKNCRDAACLLEVVSGKDKMDSTSAPQPVGKYVDACDKGVAGMKIGLPKEYFSEGIAPEIIDVVKAAAAKLAAASAEIVEVSLPHTQYALPAYYILASAEASSNLSRYDGMRYGLRVTKENVSATMAATRTEGFGDEVKRRIMIGTYVLSSGYYDAYYNKTLQVRTLIKEDFDKVFASGIDCLLTPVAPTTAYGIGEKTDDPLAMYMGDVCTVPVNISGLPGLVVPQQLLSGLPCGVQLIGKPFGEEELFRAGAAIETERMLPELKGGC